MALGCDTATRVTSRRLRTLRDEKFKFVGRYLNRVEGAHDKLTRAEAERICDAACMLSLFMKMAKPIRPVIFPQSRNHRCDGGCCAG